jgi:cytochrome bd-type quinol oxidase subunit 2
LGPIYFSPRDQPLFIWDVTAPDESLWLLQADALVLMILAYTSYAY